MIEINNFSGCNCRSNSIILFSTTATSTLSILKRRKHRVDQRSVKTRRLGPDNSPIRSGDLPKSGKRGSQQAKSPKLSSTINRPRPSVTGTVTSASATQSGTGCPASTTAPSPASGRQQQNVSRAGQPPRPSASTVSSSAENGPHPSTAPSASQSRHSSKGAPRANQPLGPSESVVSVTPTTQRHPIPAEYQQLPAAAVVVDGGQRTRNAERRMTLVNMCRETIRLRLDILAMMERDKLRVLLALAMDFVELENLERSEP